MSEEQQAAFLIDGVEYPVPTSFRLGDPILVVEVTGLEWEEFDVRYRALVAAHLAGDKDSSDMAVVLGLIAVAVWQRNPTWKRERVLRFVEQVDIASLDSIGPVEAAGEVVPVPPAAGGAHESQNGSAETKLDGSDLVTTPPVPGHPPLLASTD